MRRQSDARRTERHGGDSWQRQRRPRQTPEERGEEEILGSTPSLSENMQSQIAVATWHIETRSDSAFFQITLDLHRGTIITVAAAFVINITADVMSIKPNMYHVHDTITQVSVYHLTIVSSENKKLTKK